MNQLMIYFLMMQMVDRECVAKKQSRTNHINTNPSLKSWKKKEKYWYKLCHTLYFPQDGGQFLLVKNESIRNLEATILYFRVSGWFCIISSGVSYASSLPLTEESVNLDWWWNPFPSSLLEGNHYRQQWNGSFSLAFFSGAIALEFPMLLFLV